MAEAALKPGEAPHRLGCNRSVLVLAHAIGDVPLIRLEMWPGPAMMRGDEMEDEIALGMVADCEISRRLAQRAEFVAVAAAGRVVEPAIAAFCPGLPVAAILTLPWQRVADRLLPSQAVFPAVVASCRDHHGVGNFWLSCTQPATLDDLFRFVGRPHQMLVQLLWPRGSRGIVLRRRGRPAFSKELQQFCRFAVVVRSENQQTLLHHPRMISDHRSHLPVIGTSDDLLIQLRINFSPKRARPPIARLAVTLEQNTQAVAVALDRRIVLICDIAHRIRFAPVQHSAFVKAAGLGRQHDRCFVQADFIRKKIDQVSRDRITGDRQ